MARGKWMDGWPTRRRRTPGFDWCIICLGLLGIVRGVVVDTTFFQGDYPPHFSLEACDPGSSRPHENEKTRLAAPETRWVELLPETALAGDKQNMFAIEHRGRFTHVRLKIRPDGGVARLRVHGEVVPERERVSRAEFDLAAVEKGGRVIDSSDEFHGGALNLLMPGSSRSMADGWETRRRRGPGHDRVVLKLGAPGLIRWIEVDTSHFNGDSAESCSFDACSFEGEVAQSSALASAVWKQVLPRTKLKAGHRNISRERFPDAGAVTHVRFNLFPDGGVSRLHVCGRAERPADRLKGIELFNYLPKAKVRRARLDCCGSKRWTKQMLAQMPFSNSAHLLEAADKTWIEWSPKDWLEAIHQYQPIAGRPGKGKQSCTAWQWSTGEQSSVQQASPETLAVLAAADQACQATLAYAFWVCVTEESTEEIMANLRQRPSNEPEVELRIAAEEQRKITRLRLEKILAV